MAREITIYDVAREAGVSISTVSLALNRPQRVSAITRERVLAVVERLGFVPKESAVARARRGVGRIGVLAPFTSYSSYTRRLQGVLEGLRDTSIDVVVYDHESAASALNPLLESLPLNRHLDGIIVMGLPLEDTTAQRLLDSQLPAVLVDSPGHQLANIVIDYDEAGALVGRHLISKGHRRFAFVHERQVNTEHVLQGNLRYNGLLRALAEAGCTEEDIEDIEVANGVNGGRDAAARFAAGPATAAFCHHDALAAGLLTQLRADGVDVPTEKAVIGFDDGEIAEVLDLTTVRQPFEESGRVAARIMRDALDGDRPPVQTVSLPVELIERAST